MSIRNLSNPGKWFTEFDAQGNCTKAVYSDSYRRLLGYEAEEYADSHETWAGKIHPEDTSRVEAHFIECLEKHPEGMDYNIEYRMMTATGYRWFHDFGFCARREDGTVSRCEGVVFDIQDTVDRLAKAEDYRSLISNFAGNYDIVDLINLDDSTFSLIKSTDAFNGKEVLTDDFNRATGYYIEKLVFEPDREMMRKEMHFDTLRRRAAAEGTYSVEHRTFKDGVVRWNEMTVTGVGGSSIAIGFAQKDLYISAHRLHMKMDNDYFALFSVDFYTGLLKVMKKSPWYKSGEPGEVAPYSMVMKVFADTLEGEAKEFFTTISDLDFFREKLLKEDKQTYYYKSSNVNGHAWVSVSIYVTERNADGSPAGMSLGFSLMDTLSADRAELEAQLKEALSMAQSANRAKTAFLNNMSHDIRTPMNAIIGYTGLAASHIDNKEQVQNYLYKIGQSSNHLLSLINDVLDMSRIESGKMNLDEKPESLPDIIHTLHDIIQADINARRHDFFVDTVNVNDENVICDKLRLNQVLLNILSNAIKYTAPGGTIAMRITESDVKASGYATYTFSIKDNGIGMSEKFLKTFFDPFTRVKSSTVSGIQGTGLGMAITKNIVDMMGGKIEVNSELGKGTEVTVTVDLKLVGQQAAPEEIEEFKGLRGLIVDDDADTCMSIAKMLKDIGMRSLWCTSGKEAVLRARDAVRNNDRYKLYIVDWMMPDMNGIETVRRIRREIGDDSPIIVMTAYDWSDIEQEAREAGVTAFVSKPMFPSDIHRVLRAYINNPEPAAAQKEEFRLEGKKILLVEDNELNREIAKAILEEYGCKVFEAEDGDVAVSLMEKASEGDYDLVLMDIQMPTLNGYDATRQIRALGTPISGIPILAMTANAFEEDRRAAIDAGMNEHIAKPLDLEKLKKTLSRYLER